MSKFKYSAKYIKWCSLATRLLDKQYALKMSIAHQQGSSIDMRDLHTMTVKQMSEFHQFFSVKENIEYIRLDFLIKKVAKYVQKLAIPELKRKKEFIEKINLDRIIQREKDELLKQQEALKNHELECYNE